MKEDIDNEWSITQADYCKFNINCMITGTHYVSSTYYVPGTHYVTGTHVMWLVIKWYTISTT